MSENQEKYQPIVLKMEDIVTNGDGFTPKNYEDSELTYWVGSQHDELKQTVNLMQADERYSIQQSVSTAGEDYQSLLDTANIFLESTTSNRGWSDYESKLIDSEARRQGTHYPVVTPYPLDEHSPDSAPNPAGGGGDASGNDALDNSPTLPNLAPEEIAAVWQENRPESPNPFETIDTEATNSDREILEADFNKPIESNFNDDLGVGFNEPIESNFSDDLGIDFNEPIESIDSLETTPTHNIDLSSSDSSLDNDC